jgi:hypothetical protein
MLEGHRIINSNQQTQMKVSNILKSLELSFASKRADKKHFARIRSRTEGVAAKTKKTVKATWAGIVA